MKHTRVNFVKAPQEKWRFVLLAAAALLCLGTLIRANIERGLLMRERMLATVEVVAPKTIGKPSPAQVLRERAAALIASQLNMPFFDLMAALAPPVDIDVAMLALDLQGLGQGNTKARIHLTMQVSVGTQ